MCFTKEKKYGIINYTRFRQYPIIRHGEENMKKKLIALVLAVALLASILLASCSDTNPGDTQPGGSTSGMSATENSGFGEMDGHTHAYEYELIQYGDGFALEGNCQGEQCPQRTIVIEEGLVPEMEYVAPTCTNAGSTVWSYTKDGEEYTLAVMLPPVAGNHFFQNGVCIYCAIGETDSTTPTTSTTPTSPTTPSSHTHTDDNRDDVCDTCYASVVVVIDFYALNDLHGKFCDTDKQPGVDNLATYLKTREHYDDHVVLLSSGDMWQGAAESNLTNGLILTEWMNEMGFVSMTMGNHEYDWGESVIRKNYAVAEFPFLAINIYDRTTGKQVDYCRSSVVVDCGDIQVGIIGAIGDCYSSISADRVTNIEFKTGSVLTALVKAESERLRAQGVDFIVYSIHDGYGTSNYSSATSISTGNLASYYDASLSNGYVDLVFEGHTHQRYVYYDAYQVYHVQGGGENKGITHVEIAVNSVTGQKKVNQAEFVANSVYSGYGEDPATDALEDKYADVINNANGVLGTISSKMYSDKVEDVVSELYLRAGLERWGSQYNIVLGGGFIRTRSPYNLAAGEVTYSDLLSLLPFDNQLVLCSIKGSDLRSRFINTTNSDYHNSYSTYGNSVKNSISNNATYYVVVDMYTAVYSPNRLTIVEYYDEGVYARDLLADEIRSGRFS